MKTFLQDLAQTIKKEYAQWENLTIVFPNRRAALFFRKALAEDLDTPRWAPTIISIEEFIGSYSDLLEADKLSLVVKLFHSFKEVTKSDENLDHFYFWGEMLLRDFDEIDKYLVNAEGIFKDLSNQKEIDQYFDYLTDEQKQFLKDFWQTIDFNTSKNKEQFLALWRNLFKIYTTFKKNLLHDNIGYSGMIHRAVAEQLDNAVADKISGTQYIFGGFNALTAAEEKIISWFVQHQQAKVYWDEDVYYVSEKHREAGTFFRQYRASTILGKTFPLQPEAYLGKAKKITVIGVPQKAGQPKLLAQQLEQALKASPQNQSTVIVLPDENLLLPVLYALPPSLDAVNITMGFPLANTPYFSLIDFLFDLHLHKRKNEFYYRYVLALLNHPYIKARVHEDAAQWREFIVRKNQVYLDEAFFSDKHALLQSIFKLIEENNFFPYILGIIELLATSPEAGGVMEKEFAFHFHRIISKLQELATHEPMDMRMQQRLFRQIVRSEKVPFIGEPLKGIQVMGVLETRNLDFDNVIVLSLNEGLWPAAARQGSYLPHNIRRAYSLPTSEHQDAMYAYLFYRLLQRAQTIDLYYNTEPDVLGTGEMSRYLYQLIYETDWPIEQKILHNPVQISKQEPISIEKKPDVLEKLERYFGKALTPSTLNTYMECRLKFYFRHLLELKEPEEVEEEADARIFGNIFHKVMELFYLDIRPPFGDWFVREEHFNNLSAKLDRFTEKAFHLHFHLDENKKFEYEGQQLVVKEMVKKFAERILAHDKERVPFKIELLEANNFNTTIDVQQRNKTLHIVIGGKIDRVDKKDDTVRIMDYKTGKDENSFASVVSLFKRETKRNKAAFQAIMYGWIYFKKSNDKNIKIQPGLLNRKEMFQNHFRFGLVLDKKVLADVTYLFPEFEESLRTLITELFDPSVPFDQTDDVAVCNYCPYREICGV